MWKSEYLDVFVIAQTIFTSALLAVHDGKRSDFTQNPKKGSEIKIVAIILGEMIGYPTKAVDMDKLI